MKERLALFIEQQLQTEEYKETLYSPWEAIQKLAGNVLEFLAEPIFTEEEYDALPVGSVVRINPPRGMEDLYTLALVFEKQVGGWYTIDGSFTPYPSSTLATNRTGGQVLYSHEVSL